MGGGAVLEGDEADLPVSSTGPSSASRVHVVDLYAALNGPTLGEMPAAGLFQSDGIHPTTAGALAVAKVFAEADGMGD
jgi:hypothetical protein